MPGFCNMPSSIFNLVDSHCHIQSAEGFEGEASTRKMWEKAGETSPEDIIARAKTADVTKMICVGCTLEDSLLAVNVARSHENCWASIGVHPHEAHHYVHGLAAIKEFAALATAPKVVAVGECGLDYFYEHSDRASQQRILEFQLELAIKRNLPVIFHVREAFDDFWPIFEKYSSRRKPTRGVLHSFTDSLENLDRALRHGLYIGVNGIATFTKKPEQLEVYKAIPLASLLLETDAPFLTPVPFRGKICEPYHIRTIAEYLAELRGESLEKLAEATTRNAQQLFNI